MRRTRLALNMMAVLTVCLFCGAQAQAQATRTWVSGVGDDANPCSRTAPCKTFAGAISKTAAGGEINCLDPAGFGAVTITKSISIDCRNTTGGVLAALVNGVIINALATDEIILRGLDINGAGGAGGLDGIRFLAGGSLHVEDTTINNMTNGINVGLNQAGNAEVYVKNTYIRNNSNVGIFVSNAGTGLVNVVVERSSSENNVFGLIGRNNSRVAVRHAFFSGNSTTGILSEVLTAGPISIIDVIDSLVTNNGTGLSAGNSAQANQGNLRVSGSTISFNGTGVTAGNGAANTFADNILRDNTANGAFTLPALTKN
ncbi:MAG TPA: right-handed parallel beta-helix repeat-containing protein [Blastocatellia bacterium]